MPWYSFWKREPETAPVLQTPTLATLEPPKPLPTKPRRGGVVAAQIPRGGDVAQHLGWGLTAGRIRAAFTQAEGGYPAAQCDVFNDVIERDGHLRSLYEGYLESVSSKPWILQAGGPDPADAEAAQLLERALRAVPNVEAAWEHLVLGDFFGYSGTEIAWARDGGLTVPKWFANVPHRRFLFRPGTDEPRLITESNMIEGEPLTPGQWMFATRRSGQVVRTGLMRTAVWWAWLKGLSVRDWQIFASRFGLPFIIAQYSKDATEAQIEAVKAAILAFGQQGGAALEEGTVFDVKEPPSFSGGGAQVHPGLVDLCNSEMSKLISGATLTSGEGTSAGSYALGAVHADTKFDRTVGAAERLANRAQTDLGAAFCHFNGLRGRPPRLKVRIVREVNPKTRIEIASIYVNELGGELDDDQIREENDFKRPTGVALKRAPEPVPAGPTAEELARTPDDWKRINAAADGRMEMLTRVIEAAAEPAPAAPAPAAE